MNEILLKVSTHEKPSESKTKLLGCLGSVILSLVLSLKAFEIG